MPVSFIRGAPSPVKFPVQSVGKRGNNVKVRIITTTAKQPVRANPSDAGLDLFADEELLIKKDSLAKIKTGIAIELPEKTVGLIFDRSSLGSKGLKVHGGVIDQGYRGEIIVVIYNHSNSDYKIELGDKIAQLIVLNCLFPVIEITDSLDETSRGKNGFGSSGKN